MSNDFKLEDGEVLEWLIEDSRLDRVGEVGLCPVCHTPLLWSSYWPVNQETHAKCDKCGHEFLTLKPYAVRRRPLP